MTEQKQAEDKPPFFKNWKGMYLLVLGNLAVTILIFYLLTVYLR